MAKPMHVGLGLEGADELRDNCGLARAEADKASGDAVFEVAKVVEGALFRQLREKNRSGRLSYSLVVRRKRPVHGLHSAEVRGGGTAPYLLMREHGTSRMRAEPSIVPATEEVRPELPRLYREHFADKVAAAVARQARRNRRLGQS